MATNPSIGSRPLRGFAIGILVGACCAVVALIYAATRNDMVDGPRP
jgi:hypothetical protein